MITLSTTQQAAALARRGLPVFRLKRGTKDVHINSDWARGGTTVDPFELYTKFSTSEFNIGVLTTGLVVLDVDAHKQGLMLGHWDDRCSPPWGPDELDVVVRNAAKYRQAPIGRDNPTTGFTPVELPPSADNAPPKNLIEYAKDVSLAEILRHQANALVKGLVHSGEVGLLYGEPSAGKTFAGIDLAWHVALGKEWHGRRVKQAPALYVCLEGVGGFRKRMLAASATHGDPGDYFARLNVPVSLIKADPGRQGVETIAKAYRQMASQIGTGTLSGLIVIDTLARAMAGDDENTVADMMHFIEQRVGAIIQSTGASVLVVHHPNKAGDIRGSTSAKGAADYVIKIERDAQRRHAVAEKVKDGEEGPLFDFSLDVVQVGKDEDGSPVTSCVIRSASRSGPDDAIGRSGLSRSKTKQEAKHLKVFRDSFDASLKAGLARDLSDPDTEQPIRGIKQAIVREAFIARYTTGGEDPKKATETKRHQWRKAVRELPSEFGECAAGGVEYFWRRELFPFEPALHPPAQTEIGKSGFFPPKSAPSAGRITDGTDCPP